MHLFDFVDYGQLYFLAYQDWPKQRLPKDWKFKAAGSLFHFAFIVKEIIFPKH